MPPPQQGSLPVGWLASTGRELNPLDRDERFQSGMLILLSWSCPVARVVDYNEVRPHSSLGYQTPEEFALAWSEQASPRRPKPAIVLGRVKAKPPVAAKGGQP